MTPASHPAQHPAKWLGSVLEFIPPALRSRVAMHTSAFLNRFDCTPRGPRLIGSVAVSLALHILLLCLMLITPAKGLLKIGSTGEGRSDGAGMAIDLVQAVDVPTPMSETSLTSEAQAVQQVAEAQTQTETQVPETVAVDEQTSPTLSEASDAQDSPESAMLAAPSTSDGAGARGQNGTEEDALWNAIAPCWYRLAEKGTLPATLKVTFSPAGGLAIPPEIEREPNSPITPDVLNAEAKAISALAECGAYPMAQGKQDIEIHFPGA